MVQFLATFSKTKLKPFLNCFKLIRVRVYFKTKIKQKISEMGAFLAKFCFKSVKIWFKLILNHLKPFKTINLAISVTFLNVYY